MKLKFRINTSPERVEIVRKEIEAESEPHPRFYSMVAVSTGIAAFGLTMNNTAVIIGAMLVAPLMTPIFGIALSLVRGDGALLRRSVRAETVGVLLSVGIAVCIGFLIPELDVTEEMLSRTAPTTVNGVRTLGKKEIENLEAEVRQRTGDRKMNLYIVFNQLDLYDRWGKFNYEWSSPDVLTVEDEVAFDLLNTALQQAFKNNDYFLDSLNFKIINDEYHVVLRR